MTTMTPAPFSRRLRSLLLLLHVRLLTLAVRLFRHPFIRPSGFTPPAGGFLLEGAERIVVFRQDEWGDAVLTSAFLRELRAGCPTASITLVARPPLAEFYRGCPWVDEVLGFEPDLPTWRNRLLRHVQVFRFAAREITPRRFDAAVMVRAEADLTLAAFTAVLAGIPVRIGWTEKISRNRTFANRGFDAWLTHPFLPDAAAASEAVLAVSLLRKMGGRITRTEPELWSTPDDARAVVEAVRLLQLPETRPWIALVAGSRQPKKRWTHYDALAAAIVRTFDCELLLFGGEDEAGECDRICAAAPGRLHNLAGTTTLRQAGLWMNRCALYIGNDTGLMHAAAAAGVPVVELSGHPKDGETNHAHSPLRYGPQCASKLILQPEHALPPCSGCCTQTRPHCITQLTLERVAAAVFDFVRRLDFSEGKCTEQAAGAASRPRFTIVTATLNAAGTVAACVRSVMEQEWPGVEHLIVDGGSRDGTLEAVRACGSPFVRIVCSEPDAGIYAAFNKGLRQAAGDFVAFVGADDALLPGALRRVAAAAAEHPEAGCIHGDIEVNGRAVRPPSGLLGLGGARIFHPAAFMSRETLLAADGFDTRFRIAADLDLFLRLKAEGRRQKAEVEDRRTSAAIDGHRRLSESWLHIDAPLTRFALGGVSTRHFWKTRRETFRILRKNGRPLPFACAVFAAETVRSGLPALFRRIRG